MVIICPKCKVKLKVADEKIAPEGTRFKCPRCSTVLLVKRPTPKMKPLDLATVLVAHEKPSVMERIKSVLSTQGYRIIAVSDGITAMVNATKELPFLSLLSVSLPKIYGFEICRRLKSRPETKGMKVILIASIYDEKRYRREPESLHDADDYLEEHQIEEMLGQKINLLRGTPETARPSAPAPGTEGPRGQAPQPEDKARAEERPRPSLPEVKPSEAPEVEKARRLVRIILSDIYLYSKAKVDDSIRNGTFHKTFSSELREGLKLYENRISADIRSRGDFYNEAVNNFIEKRKKEIA
ncbi:MAG: zinc-ribbon domain-containing protein [Nitrospirae bacterium]|nr:zinc-ribbon domain-containing protein [Nitrospirota bacterium]